MSRIIAIDFDIAQQHGLNQAVVHQQIKWAIEHLDAFGRDASHQHKVGWLTARLSELARIMPLSKDQMRRSLDKLDDAGLVERQKFRAHLGDHTMSYRPVETGSTTDVAPAPEAQGPCGASAIPLEVAESPDLLSIERSETNDAPPTPPEGRGLDEVWLDWWGKRGEPGLYPAKAGSASKAKARMRKLLPGGKGFSVVFECTANYAAARQLIIDEHGVEPPVLNGSTFLNADQRFLDWEEPWTLERAEAHWSVILKSHGANTGRYERTEDWAMSDEELEKALEEDDGFLD